MAPGMDVRMTPGDTSHYPQEAHWCSWSGAGKRKLSAPGRPNSLPQPYLPQYWVLASAPFIKYYFKRNASKWKSMEEAREETVFFTLLLHPSDPNSGPCTGSRWKPLNFQESLNLVSLSTGRRDDPTPFTSFISPLPSQRLMHPVLTQQILEWRGQTGRPWPRLSRHR